MHYRERAISSKNFDQIWRYVFIIIPIIYGRSLFGSTIWTLDIDCIIEHTSRTVLTPSYMPFPNEP